MNKILRRVLILVSGLIVIGSASAVLIVYIALGPAIKDIPYEENTWKTGTNRAQMQFPRQKMVDELINSKALLGKSEEDIREILGKPDSIYDKADSLKTYSYFVGPARRLASADNEWLEVYFSSKNVVVNNELVVH